MMDANIDISKIDDLDKLKSLAYDQIAAKEVAENNLQKINNRIATVQGMGEQYRAAAPGLSVEDQTGVDELEP